MAARGRSNQDSLVGIQARSLQFLAHAVKSGLMAAAQVGRFLRVVDNDCQTDALDGRANGRISGEVEIE